MTARPTASRHGLILLLALAPLGVADAQDPVIKPTTTVTRSATRLPLPTGLSARQQPDGRIVVSWARIPGAVKYQIVRSVPPAVATMLPNVTDTSYVDGDVVAGKSYYYQIAGIDETGVLGLKASAYIAATVSTTTGGATTAATPLPPAPVLVQGTGALSRIEWPGTGDATRYEVVRVECASVSADSTMCDPRTGGTSRRWSVDARSRNILSDTLPANPVARWAQYRVTAITPFGTGRSASSTPRLVPATATTADSTSTTTTTTTTTITTTAIVGSTPVASSIELSVVAGSSIALAERTGIASARWSSMHADIASVDPVAGHATGRAAGVASIVALVPQSDGSVRVSVIRLRVTP